MASMPACPLTAEGSLIVSRSHPHGTRHGARAGRGRARGELLARARRDARPRRRIGLRQVDDRARDPRPPARRRADFRPGALRGARPPRTRREGAVRRARGPHRRRLPGADDGAEPAAHDRPPDRRDARPASRARARGEARREADAPPRPGRHPGPGAARRRLSAPALGRAAPARHHRDRARLRAGSPDRRRADDGARRDHPAPDPRPHRRSRRGALDGAAPDLARSRRHRRECRAHARDVWRLDRRERRDGGGVREALAPLYARPLRGAAAARRRARREARDDRRHGAGARRHAERLPFRRPLPA